MLGGVDESHAVIDVTQKKLSSGKTLEYALFAFFTKFAAESNGLGNQANKRFGLMGVELVNAEYR